jgi:hypothetical protein
MLCDEAAHLRRIKQDRSLNRIDRDKGSLGWRDRTDRRPLAVAGQRAGPIRLARRRVPRTDGVRSAFSKTAERRVSGVGISLQNAGCSFTTARNCAIKPLAESEDTQSEILTTNAYKLSLERGVENPSQHVGQLVTVEYGAELDRIRERYYRFQIRCLLHT